MQQEPISYILNDGTKATVFPHEEGVYAIHLTRLNSEKHNFLWISDRDEIEESYETRFDQLQQEAVQILKERISQF